jgi:hypothetical protein
MDYLLETNAWANLGGAKKGLWSRASHSKHDAARWLHGMQRTRDFGERLSLPFLLEHFECFFWTGEGGNNRKLRTTLTACGDLQSP